MKHEHRAGRFAPVSYLKNVVPKGQVQFSGIELFFWAAYAASAFTAAYLQEKGYSASVVGLIMALVNCIGIVAAPMMGSLSDRLSSSRRVFLLCIAVSSVLYCVVPFIPGTNAVAVVATTVALLAWAFFKNPTSSLLDGWLVRTVARRRTFRYGAVRLLGSIGYATMCIIFGRIAAALGTQKYSFFFYGILNIPLILLCIFGMDDERADEESMRREKAEKQAAQKADGKKKKGKSPLAVALKGYYFRMFLFSHALLGLTLYCMTTFLPYKLTEIAGNANSMGTVIAMKSYMEIPTFLFGAAIMKRLNVKQLFPICAGVFFFEQFACLVASQTWMVAISLMLHGFTYGMYLTCMVNYVYRVTPAEAANSAMTIAGSLQLGVSVVGSLIGGVLVDRFGSAGYYAFSMTMQLIALVIFLVTYPLGRKLGHAEPDLSDL